jgi:hypothetical protein
MYLGRCYSSGHCEKNVHMDVCLILNVYRNKPFEPPDITPLIFCGFV